MSRFGWVPDIPDIRDQAYSIPVIKKVPEHVDLRPGFPPVYDQGDLGCCVGTADAGAYAFQVGLQHGPTFNPSSLFIYYNARVIEGSVDYDSGVSIRDSLKSIKRQGVSPEEYWPYIIDKFAVKPTYEAYKQALDHQAIRYMRLRGLYSFQSCLASGYPFVFGFTVYESFMSDEVANTGTVPIPSPGETALGGHAVVAVGYDATPNKGERRFIVRNSWGDGWGDKGYFTMPFSYLANPGLASDFWTLRKVE